MANIKIGFTLSSEEFDPLKLLRLAQKAEEAGFEFLSISDHYHPWIDKQGQSAFVWSTLGGLSQVTQKVKVMVGVTAPIIRYHPVIIAQAAATVQYMFKGRFILGLGTGENLNEHIVGEGWPPISIRREMLREAIEIIRLLWEGGYKSYCGDYYTVEDARIYTISQDKIPIVVSAFGILSAKLAGEMGDGFVTTTPDKEIIDNFKKNSLYSDKPVFGQMSVCFDENVEKAKSILKTSWPLAGLPKPLNTELRLPRDFEATARLVRIEDVTEKVPVGRDASKIMESIQKYIDAGFTHVFIHNIGPNQEEFIKFASENILPQFK